MRTAGRRRSFRGRRRSRGKSVPLGVKLGAMIAVLPPVVVPAIDAGQAFLSPNVKKADIFSKLQYSFASWIDSLAFGFGLDKPYASVQITDVDGSINNRTTVVTAPKGLFLTTTTVGLTTAFMAGVQAFLARKLAGVKQVKLMNRRIA